MFLLTEAAENLIGELQERFPASLLMDAFGFVYLQYWLQPNAERDFLKHLAIIKEHYGMPKEFGAAKTTKSKKKSTVVTAVHSNTMSASDGEDEILLRPAGILHKLSNSQSRLYLH